MNFGQVVTAMVTPFDIKENIDFHAVEKLVNYLIENGSDSLVVAGTTGESPTLSSEEKITLFKRVVEISNGRAKVIAGTGSNSTTASMELTKQAETAGVDAIMLVTPYYNKPSQEGIFQHFSTIASATSLPIMLYNVPGRTATNIEADTIIRLSQLPNIVSVKEASGDLDQMTTIIHNTPDNFSLYSGDDSLTLPALAIGADGVVSVASHIVGNQMRNMIQHFRSGDITTSAKLHQKLLPIMKAMFAQPSPAPVKSALNILDVAVGSVRLPIQPLTENEVEMLKQKLHASGILKVGN
ncbi:4-hydroxy-tetrahydrodipicolinate synthase [Virgibacillus pantothenticus]|uniref:4-hydroxy-tetrahydrodipicolinate synthase n=1 Tax=Virgibacillus pantothenticus TaxID=1473 RepID=UPI000986491E|nr:4-hydroxy-tetrahydrodipicolinate synthase [Virgibacillus pantothenticus]